MKEITRKNWDQFKNVSNEETLFLFLETPLCGTCKVGRKMFEVAVETLQTQIQAPIQVATCNINGIPELAETYGVTSVPCLLMINRGIALKKVYAMQSAAFLYSTMLEKLAKSIEEL